MQKFKGRKTLVTGATGLLGGHLVEELLKSGAEVVTLVRDSLPHSYYQNHRARVTEVRGDLRDLSVLERTINEYEIDTVFHLGAQTLVGTANRNPIATFESNIQGTWNLLEACRMHQKQIKAVIIASSDKAYGNLEGAAYDESFPLNGTHPYDVSKSCADLISKTYAHSYGLPVAITRCGNFYGAGDFNYSRIVPGTIRSIIEGQAPLIRSDGKLVRDYIYVKDGALAYMTLAEHVLAGKIKPGEAFNFSYGLKLQVMDVANAILKSMNSQLSPKILNEAHNEIPVQTLVSEKAKKQLNWKPTYGFDEGLKETIRWYQTFFKSGAV